MFPSEGEERQSTSKHKKHLAPYSAHEQALVAESMREALFDQGDVIVAQGAQPDCFYILEVSCGAVSFAS